MIKQTKDGVVLRIKISPNSKSNEIILEEDFAKIKITAQPIEGKANKALIEFLSKKFKIPKTSIKILKGETSKEKTILFEITDDEKLKFVTETFTK